MYRMNSEVALFIRRLIASSHKSRLDTNVFVVCFTQKKKYGQTRHSACPVEILKQRSEYLIEAKVYSEPCQVSKMELFAKIVKS